MTFDPLHLIWLLFVGGIVWVWFRSRHDGRRDDGDTSWGFSFFGFFGGSDSDDAGDGDSGCGGCGGD